MDEEVISFFRGNGDYRSALQKEFGCKGIDFIESTLNHSGLGPNSFILGSGLEVDLHKVFVETMEKLGTERLYILRDFYIQTPQPKKKQSKKK